MKRLNLNQISKTKVWLTLFQAKFDIYQNKIFSIVFLKLLSAFFNFDYVEVKFECKMHAPANGESPRNYLVPKILF